MTTSYATSVTNSAINSFYIGEDGLAFNTDGFVESLYSAETISGAIGAGVTAGLNATTIGYNNQYVNGFNSQQIGNIQSLNSLVGGLATNATSLLMGGNANLNLLSYKGVGMLEFSFGKDGISSKIGMGGTNISYQNLVSAFGGATHLHVNRQIDNTEYDKTTQDALKSQYGFGDEQAKAQLDDIINGDTVLKFDAEGSEVAQSVTENGQKIIHINSTLNDGFIDLGLTLQHEAHRDGIVGDEQSQQIETTNAVLGHTVMAKKMQNDNLYKSMMNDIIDTNQNLQNDLAVFDYAVETGDWGAFGSYVNAAYDSSADYWKLMDDGSLAYDGKANLYDENGNLIYKTEKTGLEGSLVEILYGKNATEEQIDEVRNLMDENFSHYTVGDDANNKNNWYWNGKVTEENMGKQISGLTVFGKYGNSIVSQAYAHHFDSTVDAIYAAANGIDIGTVDMKTTAFFSMDRFRKLYKAKSLFYESAGALVDYDETTISQKYKQKYPGNYANYDELHYGIDLVAKDKLGNHVDNVKIKTGLSGKVVSNSLDAGDGTGAGNSVHIQYGFSFEGSFISTGIYGEYDHLTDQSKLSVNMLVTSTMDVGIMGSTGNSTGQHLHYSVYTTGQNNYSDTTMQILFGKNYVGSVMQSISTNEDGSKEYKNKYVYDPTYFFINNRRHDKKVNEQAVM